MEFEVSVEANASTRERVGLAARGKKLLESWIGRISGALLDQLSFSGCNFLINVLLARHMIPDDFGAYVVAYTWFQLAQNMYDAFISEPLVIFGSGKFRDRFRAYLGYAYRGHGMFSLVSLAALGVATLLAYQFDQRVVALALLGATAATPLILMRWLTKAPLYVMGRPYLGAVANAIYLGIVAGGIFALDGIGLLTPFSAMLLLGIGIAVGALLLTLLVLKPEWKERDTPLYREALGEHLHYGKWSTGYRLLNWAPPSAITFLTSSLLGLASTGAYRALNGLIMPMGLIVSAVVSILVPAYARTYTSEGKAALGRMVMITGAALVGAAVVYGLGTILVGRSVASWIYDGQYDTYTTFLFMLTLGAAPAIGVLQSTLEGALRVMGGVRQVFVASLAPSLLMVGLSALLMPKVGLIGANIALLIGSAAAVPILLWFYRRIG